MISFLLPETEFPAESWADKIAKAHREYTNRVLQEALIERFGELPPMEEILAHCVNAVGTDGVEHYVWVEKKHEIGDHIDMSDVLCSIEPPNFGGMQ